jgi:hypothetical protein
MTAADLEIVFGINVLFLAGVFPLAARDGGLGA